MRGFWPNTLDNVVLGFRDQHRGRIALDCFLCRKRCPYLESNALVRLVPSWYADLGSISLYYATRTLLPAKTRFFVDFVLEAFRRDRLAERFAGSLGSVDQTG